MSDDEVRKIRVLVVDDDSNVRTVVAIHLRQLGFEVEPASNGFEAFNILAGYGRTPFDADVILLDLLMPVMDGYEFLERYEGCVPVVVMSGLGDIAKLPRQPFALVVKPMSMFEAADTLREAALSWRTHECPLCMTSCRCPEGNDMTPRRGDRTCVHECEGDDSK